MFSGDTGSTPLNNVSPISVSSTISSIEPLGSPAIRGYGMSLLSGHFRSQSQQENYFSRSNTPDLSVGKRKYVPSHLSQLPYRKSYTPDRSSPLVSQPSFTARPSTSSIRKISTSPPNWFGGPSFGTPKSNSRRGKAGHKIQEEEAPPVESLYDVEGNIVMNLESNEVSESSKFLRKRNRLNETEFNSTPESTRIKETPKSSIPTAVILFGFPATLTSHVISHFSRYGEILDHSSTENPMSTGSNWLKITYADEESANKAVSSNGTIIGGTYMVGCIFAPVEEPNTKTDKDIDMVMDLDAKTPSSHCSINPRHSLTHISHQESPNIVLRTPSNTYKTSSCNGQRIEVLGSEGIFKETPDKTYSWITWSSVNKSTTQEHQQTENKSQWSKKLVRGIMELLFGF
ncbi:hypothetical protein T552_00384 [Pneumocystis carinii B80]|uniref:RRM Nup35-type domain-containing protein n=1 Tax=Pneumocystis carinii (strain B80) TaxID=1408658 RepID=A0A0W4ZQM2_PNEC8|nr:hypothetical protein T552_00384 [Pneumocystis carinii B80]KTW30671.1 hypothetical protein T552_00384 [Pneumocystis carinii B80]